MTKSYDDSFHPPDWWLEALEDVQAPPEPGKPGQGWGDPKVIELANAVANRATKWGPDRLSKMRKGKTATIQLIVAVSEATGIPSPVFLPKDRAEAEALRTWHNSRKLDGNAGKLESRKATALQALESTVKAKQDQTKAVESKDEGSPRGRGRRSASRGG